MPQHSRRCLLSGLLAVGAAAGLAPHGGHARQQAAPAWPTRPVTILVPFAPGGPSDIVARAIATRMQQGISQPVVVRTGRPPTARSRRANSPRASRTATLIMVGSIGVFALNAVLSRNPGYDPLRDFAYITLAVTTPNVLVVNPQASSRRRPSRACWTGCEPTAARPSHATSGIGSSPHLTMELFTQLADRGRRLLPRRRRPRRSPTRSPAGPADLVPGPRDYRAVHPVKGGSEPIPGDLGRAPARCCPQVPTAVESRLGRFRGHLLAGGDGAGRPSPPRCCTACTRR